MVSYYLQPIGFSMLTCKRWCTKKYVSSASLARKRECSNQAPTRAMPPWLLQSTPYKGLFILILVFVAFDYIFNSFSVTREVSFNSTKQFQSSVVKLVNNTKNITLNTTTFSYIVTLPPMSNNVTDVNSINNTATDEKLSQCPDISPYLYGRVTIRKYPVPSVQSLKQRFSWLHQGGSWAPTNCTVQNRVALIVPFRGRSEHLLLFLQHMHPYLRRQWLNYTIFVVEQDGDGPFNRAMLMNIGYVESLKLRKYDCFIFHDIDLLPEDDRNVYTCPEHPRHMSVAVDIFQYKLPYPAIFGGVSAINANHFKLLNGFSNSFWGWGGEDDDMANRIRYHHLQISRYPITIARYTMLTHKKDAPNPNRYELLRKGQKTFSSDGLSNLNYNLLMKKEHLLYTWILAEIHQPQES